MAERYQRSKCTAISRRSGKRCGSWATKGFKVCRMHGSGGKKKGHPQIATNLKHGRDAWKFKRILQQQGVDRIEELATSPEVLNLARTVAASQFLIEEHVPMQMTDEELVAVAKLKMKLDREPTEAEKTAVRLDMMETAQKALLHHGTLQEKAKKALSQEALMAILVVPILSQLGQQFMGIVSRHVDDRTLEAIRSDIDDARQTAVVKAHHQIEGM